MLRDQLPKGSLVSKDRSGYIKREIGLMDGKVVPGHVTARFVKSLAGNPQVFTVLREPKERLLSHFYFLKGYTQEYLATYQNETMLRLKAMTLAEFLRDSQMNSWCRDFYVKSLDPLYEKGDLNASVPIANRALDFMRGCTVVGIMPCLQAFVREAFPYFGINPNIEVPYVNRRSDLENQRGFEPVALEPLTQEDDERLVNLTRNDRLLYEYAMSVAPR